MRDLKDAAVRERLAKVIAEMEQPTLFCHPDDLHRLGAEPTEQQGAAGAVMGIPVYTSTFHPRDTMSVLDKATVAKPPQIPPRFTRQIPTGRYDARACNPECRLLMVHDDCMGQWGEPLPAGPL